MVILGCQWILGIRVFASYHRWAILPTYLDLPAIEVIHPTRSMSRIEDTSDSGLTICHHYSQ
jgi:hypothetical protein